MNVTAHIDGGSRGNPGPSAIGVVVSWPFKVDSLHKKFIGRKTNNEAEYAALIWTLNFLSWAGATKVVIYSDSQLIVNQFNGGWVCREERLKPLLAKALELSKKFEVVGLFWNPREENREADLLANEAMDEEEEKNRKLLPAGAEAA